MRIPLSLVLPLVISFLAVLAYFGGAYTPLLSALLTLGSAVFLFPHILMVFTFLFARETLEKVVQKETQQEVEGPYQHFPVSARIAMYLVLTSCGFLSMALCMASFDFACGIIDEHLCNKIHKKGQTRD